MNILHWSKFIVITFTYDGIIHPYIHIQPTIYPSIYTHLLQICMEWVFIFSSSSSDQPLLSFALNCNSPFHRRYVISLCNKCCRRYAAMVKRVAFVSSALRSENKKWLEKKKRKSVPIEGDWTTNFGCNLRIERVLRLSHSQITSL